MKKLIPILLALALGGCSGFNPFGSTSNPVSTQSLVTVEAGYGAALSLANGYKQACASKAITGSCRTVVATLQNAEKYAYGELLVARNFVKNNPTVDATVVITTAQQALKAFQDAETANGVK